MINNSYQQNSGFNTKYQPPLTLAEPKCLHWATIISKYDFQGLQLTIQGFCECFQGLLTSSTEFNHFPGFFWHAMNCADNNTIHYLMLASMVTINNLL